MADPRAVAEATRFSFLVIVIDTLRKDAVSAYGSISGTTPEMDALASQGLRFDRAVAPSPWTLPSHATLFTGRRIDEHGVGLAGHSVLGTEWPTIAEVLRRNRYETAAFSENAIVSEVFGLLRGFEVQKTSRIDAESREITIDGPTAVRSWLADRDERGEARPFFVFVNLLDAHAAYEIRERNPWVPAGSSSVALRTRAERPELLICGGLPTPEQIAIQRGLYHGDVHEADRKLGEIVRSVRKATGAETPLITIVLSDHGELFGEGQLMGHEFSLHSGLLDIPLIVHGLSDVASAVIDSPVGLEDLMPSLLRWAAVDSPEALPGNVLPTEDGIVAPGSRSTPGAESRALFSAYSDAHRPVPEAWQDRVARKDKDRVRQFCSESNPVFGGMASLLRYPFKYVWYERYPAKLHDLSWDPAERSDVSRHHPELIQSLESELAPFLESAGLLGHRGDAAEIPESVVETLKALGYAE